MTMSQQTMTFSHKQTIACISSSSVPPTPITRGSLGDSGLISLLLEEEELMYSDDDDDDDDNFKYTTSITISNDAISNTPNELSHTRQRQKKLDSFASKKKESFEDDDQVAQRSRMNGMKSPLSNEQKQQATIKRTSTNSSENMNSTPKWLRT